MINERLFDLFYIGPLDIIISSYVKNIYLKYFMLLVGITNILYNGHNYLLLDIEFIKKPFPIFKPLVNMSQGKTQLHRMYNLFIMYPILIYVYKTTNIPKTLKTLFLINIIVGIIYNLYYFLYFI